MRPYEYWWHGPWSFMWLIPVIFLILFAIFVLRGGSMRGRGDRDEKQTGKESAAEILDRRYASGEITKEQYVEMKRTLNG